jgi:RNA polymerase sigma-70 factor, ECF subfamily
MNQHPENDEFCCDLVNVQRGLFAYIIRLLPNVTDANDVLQKTNLVVLSKRDDFRPGADFNAWVIGIARHQVLAFRRDASRTRLMFSEQLLGQLADRDATRLGGVNVMSEALGLCRGKLSEGDQQLLDYRYTENLSVTKIAETVGREPHAVSQALYRIRTSLLECIQQVICSEENNDGGRPGS